MKQQKHVMIVGKKKVLASIAMMGLVGVAIPAAHAATTFDVIGPHEYELPVNFKPFNVFVQYGYVQDDSKTYNNNGDKVAGSGAQTIVGLSKYVRFWTPEGHPDIGLAYEVIVPEIGVRNQVGSASGFGDPLTGFAIWMKPSPTSTFGFQSFVQVPVGDNSVSDTNWKNLSSFLWDVRLTDQWGWTADAGMVFQGSKNNGVKPGNSFHTNQRLGYRATSLIEPFIAVDYEKIKGSGANPDGFALDAGLGVVLHTFDNQSITLRYATTLDAKNHSANDSFNIKYAYVW